MNTHTVHMQYKRCADHSSFTEVQPSLSHPGKLLPDFQWTPNFLMDMQNLKIAFI